MPSDVEGLAVGIPGSRKASAAREALDSPFVADLVPMPAGALRGFAAHSGGVGSVRTVRTGASPFHAGLPGAQPGEGVMGGGLLGIIAANTMNGPGLLAIPGVFRTSGWLVSSLGLGVAAVLTGDTASLLSSAITVSLNDRILGYASPPGSPRKDYGAARDSPNSPGMGVEEEDEPEFGNLAKQYLGSSWEVVTQVLLGVSLTMLTCAQVVVTSQAIDAAIVYFFGQTAALQYYPSPKLILSADTSLHPFGEGLFAVSLGFVVDMVVCVTLGFFDLSANMLPQYLSSAASLFAFSVFAWQLLLQPPLEHEVPALPLVGPDTSPVVGVAVFNFAYIIAVPSLQMEAAPKANFKLAMWAAVLGMLAVYVSVGGAGGMHTSPHDQSANLLNLFMRAGAPEVTRIAVFAYAAALVLPIPVYVILLRRTIEQGGMAPGTPAIVVSNLIPWGMALVMYMQPWFGAIINWSSLLCLGFINYSIPLALVVAIRREHHAIQSHRDVTLWEALKADEEAMRAGLYFVFLTFVAVPAAIALSVLG
eukprot:Hpha_TRINITY_DN33803_c0_g1::TRINITY_DN33803_c0_g1_i1::g.27329::m.27329